MKQVTMFQDNLLSGILTGLFFLLLLWPCACPAGEVTLAWDANTETNIAGYKLYYDGDSDTETYGGTDANEGDSPIAIYPAQLADPNAPDFTLTGLTDGEYYCFSLTAFDTDGLESDFSDEIGITVGSSVDTPQPADSPTSDTSTVSYAASVADSDSTSSGRGCFISNTTMQGSPLFPIAAVGISLLFAAVVRPARSDARAFGRTKRRRP